MPPGAARVARPEITGRICLVLALLLCGAAPVTADWLLTHDGTRVETAGRWQVDEGLVKFELPHRRGLFSMSLDRVDLAGSEALTRAERERGARSRAQRPEESPRRAPVLVLTDRDVRKVKRDPNTRPEARQRPLAGALVGEAPIDPPQRLPRGLEVVGWRQSVSPETDTVVIEGELRNTGRELVVGLELDVRLMTEGGGVAASRTALLSASVLAPRQRSLFRAEFGDPVVFDEVEFEVVSPEVGF